MSNWRDDARAILNDHGYTSQKSVPASKKDEKKPKNRDSRFYNDFRAREEAAKLTEKQERVSKTVISGSKGKSSKNKTPLQHEEITNTFDRSLPKAQSMTKSKNNDYDAILNSKFEFDGSGYNLNSPDEYNQYLEDKEKAYKNYIAARNRADRTRREAGDSHGILEAISDFGANKAEETAINMEKEIGSGPWEIKRYASDREQFKDRYGVYPEQFGKDDLKKAAEKLGVKNFSVGETGFANGKETGETDSYAAVDAVRNRLNDVNIKIKRDKDTTVINNWAGHNKNYRSLSDDEKEFIRLARLYWNNDYRDKNYNAAESFGKNAVSGLTFGLTENNENYINSVKNNRDEYSYVTMINPEKITTPGQKMAQISNEHPIASTAGSIAGDVVRMALVDKGVGHFMPNASAPLRLATTMGIDSGLHSLGSGENPGTASVKAATGFVGGAIAGKAGEYAGELIDKGITGKAISEVDAKTGNGITKSILGTELKRAGLNTVAKGTAMTAANYPLRKGTEYLLDRENFQISPQEIAQEFVTNLLFAGFGEFKEALKRNNVYQKAAGERFMDELGQKIAADYDKIRTNPDSKTVVKKAGDVIAYTDEMLEYLDNIEKGKPIRVETADGIKELKVKLAGQKKNIVELKNSLNKIKTSAREYVDGNNGAIIVDEWGNVFAMDGTLTYAAETVRAEVPNNELSAGDYSEAVTDSGNTVNAEQVSTPSEDPAAFDNGEAKYLQVGKTIDGKTIYKTNYPTNTPKQQKQADLINLVQSVWSQHPIVLQIDNGKTITAQFDPDLSTRSDLSKIVFGNRKGTAKEQRITLNLASDLYHIAQESQYQGEKSEMGKNNPAHNGVKSWKYFVTDLVYVEDDGTKIPGHVNIDVKQKTDGSYFYSFAFEKGVAPQTLLAAVSEETSPTTPYTDIIPQNEQIVNNAASSEANNRAEMVTENITNSMNERTGAPTQADNMQNANSRIQSDSRALFDRDFVRDYTKDFLIGMAQRNNVAFNALQQMDGYVGNELVNEVIDGSAATEYKNNNYFRMAANELKNVIADAAEKNVIMHNRAYGENEQLSKQAAAMKGGDFSVINTQNRYGFTEIAAEDRVPELIRDEYSEWLTADEAKAIDDLASLTGRTVKFTDELREGKDGCYLDGVLYISTAAENPYMVVMAHELTHSLESTPSYTQYSNAVLDILARNSGKYITELVNEKMADYGSKGVELSDDGAKRELVAEYTQNILSTPEEAMEFVRKLEEAEANGTISPGGKRNIIQSVIDAIKNLLSKIKGTFKKTPQAVKDLQNTRELFEDMLKEAANETSMTEQTDNVQFSKTGSFAEQVHNVLNGETQGINHIYVGETTSLLRQLGLNDKPMLITEGHLKDMHHEKIQGITKYHGLSEETINKMPYILNHPAIVFDSVNEKNSDTVCLLSEVQDDEGLPILLVVKPDGKGKYNNIRVESNFILTMFGKDGAQNFLNKIGENIDNVLFMDQKRTQEMLRGGGLYLPNSFSNLKFNTIIHKTKNVVNTENQGNSVDKEPQFLFAGKNAKNANLTALAKAIEMEKSGASNEEIRQATKWAKGLDGEWRFELDDSKAKYIKADLNGKKKTYVTLSDILEHNELYEAYPDLRDVPVRLTENNGYIGGGEYLSGADVISINQNMDYPEETRQTLLHEDQHAIQAREGFAEGASYDPEHSELYENSAGEIEANDVKARANLTAEERQAIFPESMKPREGVIINKATPPYENPAPLVFDDKGVKVRSSESVETNNKVKITRDMTDSERYNVLKDREIEVVKYNPKKMKQVEGLNENELNTQFKKAAKPLLNKIADEFNVFKSYSIEDIELEANYSHGSFNESTNKQHKNYQDFGKLLTVFDDVIKNAVGIEVHDDIYKGTQKENPNLLNTYVLISAFQDGEDTIPVKLVVKELDNDPNKIHLTVSANKIKAEISAQASGENARLPYAPSASTISLSKMFKKINPKDAYLLKYIPEGFLTDEQKAAVREENVKGRQRIQPLTKDFKQWFGDWQNDPDNASKVVNADGTPKVVYHGTSEDFTAFDPDMIGANFGQDEVGFFFTDSEKSARNYADTTSYGSQRSKPGNVIGAYLDIKNPLILKTDYDPIDMWDSGYEKYVKQAQSKGNDGIIIKAQKGESLYVAFNPTQIKSATDNIGTFDPNNADIRFSLSEKVEEYGAIPKGEKPARDVEVPKKISKDKYVSRFARTAMEAGVTPDEAVSEFEKEILDGTMTHEVMSDKKAMENAESLIKNKGFKAALDAWDVLIDRGKALSKSDIALGQQLYNQCINNKDVTNAMKIASDLAVEATRAGQNLQAVRMLKKLSPDGKLYYLERSVKDINKEFKNKLGDAYKDVRLNEDLMKEFLEADTDEARDEVYDKICQDIADQIPSTGVNKWNAWRYLSMLGNPRTHIRNIVGNAVFYPAVRIKSYMNAGLEKVFIEKDNRTSSFTKNKESKAYSAKDFPLVKRELQGVNAKYAVTDDIESKRTIFKWGDKVIVPLEFLRKKNGDLLEAEDLWFLKAHYEDAFARVMTARGITAEQLDADTKESKTLLNKIREIAMREAQEATYRDANSVANALNKMQRGAEKSKNRAVRSVGVGIEAVMPFKKTPLNIAKRGIEYSPIGLLNGVWNAATGVKKKKITASEAINKISKGFVGTGLMMIGYLLANMGLLTGEGDENKKKADFDGLVGKQNYALNIDGKSYTIDWMAPISMPLFIGVELNNATKNKDWTFAKAVNAMSTISNPLLELSCLSSLQSTIQSAQYSENNVAFAIVEDMATSYLTQGLPTFGGQLARMIDRKKRNPYYKYKDSQLPAFVQQFIGQVAAKVPGASKLLEPKIDKWGREEDYGELAERMIENSISPGYYSEERYTKVDEELERLNKAVGGSDMFPIGVQKYIKIDGVTYNLNVHQYTQFARIRGQKSLELVQDLMSSKIKRKKQGAKKATTVYYSSLSDIDKVKEIKKCYDDALEYAKEQMKLMLGIKSK